MAFYDEDDALEAPSSSMMQKFKENPTVPIGFAGCIAVVGHQLYKIKSRGDQKLWIYLTQMRVAAQGFFVGSLVVGITYSMCRDYIKLPMKSRKEENTNERGL